MLATDFCPGGKTFAHHAADSAPSGGLTSCLPAGKPRIVAARDHVYRQGEPATHFYRVASGHVCVYRLLPDGRRQVINFAFPGDFIGLGAREDHASSAQAGSKCLLTSYPVGALRDIAGRSPALGLELYDAMTDELAAARDLLVTVSQRTASERLATFLVALSRRNRRRGEDDSEIVLPMTRTDIADFLGLTIETVSRTFTKFRNQGLIDLEQCVLVVLRDLDGLERLAGGGSSSGAKHAVGSNLAA